ESEFRSQAVDHSSSGKVQFGSDQNVVRIHEFMEFPDSNFILVPDPTRKHPAIMKFYHYSR
ncbi:MAG TPA: hypothetical protein VJ742_10385, partial [Nitrososphaera sp.]|nr:hypothetical protein [Nitrososphaera sp.]